MVVKRKMRPKYATAAYLVLLEVRAVGHCLGGFPHPVAVLGAPTTELQLGADVAGRYIDR